MSDAWKSLSEERITGELGDHLVLQAPFIPNMGGIFESTVKQVKRAMKTIINDQLLPEETLHTVLVEAEVIINSRPCTGVSDDINENQTLTPNHLHQALRTHADKRYISVIIIIIKPLPHRTSIT